MGSEDNFFLMNVFLCWILNRVMYKTPKNFLNELQRLSYQSLVELK